MDIGSVSARKGSHRNPGKEKQKSMAGKSKSSNESSYRSAKSGRYVTEKYGKSHKSTTVKETNKRK